MAIVNMSKFSLVSFNKEREELLEALQSFNYVHFNKLLPEGDYLKEADVTLDETKVDRSLSNVERAIELLKPYEESKGMLQSLKDGNPTLSLSELEVIAKSFDFEEKYAEMTKIENNISNLKKELITLNTKLSDLNKWKNVSISIGELRNMKNARISIGSISVRNYEELAEALLDYNTVEILKSSADKNSTYIIIISTLDVSEEVDNLLLDKGFTPVNIPTNGVVSHEIESTNRIISNRQEQIKENRVKLSGYSKYLGDLRAYAAYLKNAKNRINAEEQFLNSKKVDFIEGYVPTDREGDFISTLNKTLGEDYYMEINPADRDDPNVPILLKNNIFVQPFESLTEMYAMPRYNEIDPTPLFAPFYFIFAGMMVGDIGYGLILLIGCIIGLKIFNLDKGTRRMAGFLLLLSISTIIWGVVYGSFFGDLLGDSFPYKPFINPSEDYMKMIGLSLGLGVFHIFFALGIKAYMYFRDGKPLDALYDVGFWYMALIGAGVALGGSALGLSPMAKKIALGVMAVGMIGIVATGGRDQESIPGKIGWGIYSLYGISSYVGDVVSYFRVMALVLSGSFIALAVNIIVKLLFTKGIFGMVGAIVIFIAFQLFNVFLSFLSAYVHTARLTFVEMFNKFYEGGGIPFRKMVAESNYYNIKED